MREAVSVPGVRTRGRTALPQVRWHVRVMYMQGLSRIALNGAVRGLVVSIMLLAFPLTHRLGTLISHGHALWPGEIWMSRQ